MKTNDEIRQGLKKLADDLEGQTIEPYYAPWIKDNLPELFKESKKTKVR